MNRLYYNVVDCEHEGDVDHAIAELLDIGAARIILVDYQYEDDEDPEADHEICGCTIFLEAPESEIPKLKAYGCY